MTTPTPEQMRALADKLQSIAASDFGSAGDEMFSAQVALRAAADQLEAVRQEVSNYAGWYEYSPEDSWRFERDIRSALGMEQFDKDADRG